MRFNPLPAGYPRETLANAIPNLLYLVSIHSRQVTPGRRCALKSLLRLRGACEKRESYWVMIQKQ